MQDFLSLAMSRYSCRAYAPTPVSDAQISRILEAAKVAPTACNLQPFRLLVLTGESLKKIEKTAWLYGAPLAIVLCTVESEAWQRKYDSQNFAVVDGAIVMTHMLLEATEMGLGTCFVGAIKIPLLTEALKLDPALCPQFIMVAGHKAESEESKPHPRHYERKSLDDLVTYLN